MSASTAPGSPAMPGSPGDAPDMTAYRAVLAERFGPIRDVARERRRPPYPRHVVREPWPDAATGQHRRAILTGNPYEQ